MCGRFALSLTPARLRAVFGCAPPRDFRPRWNIAPDTPILVIRSAAHGREAVWMRWGLVPPWSRNFRDPARQINARIETAADRPMFRRAFRRRRGLVPADGFYEWQKQPRAPSRPFFVRDRSGAPMAFAALWERCEGTQGEVLETVAILTMDAHPSLRHLHGRMPVALPPRHWDMWLDPALEDVALLKSMLEEAGAVAFAHFEVDRRVNDPRNDDADLLVPVSRETGASGEIDNHRLQPDLF